LLNQRQCSPPPASRTRLRNFFASDLRRRAEIPRDQPELLQRRLEFFDDLLCDDFGRGRLSPSARLSPLSQKMSRLAL
jgi:hypothetical protein